MDYYFDSDDRRIEQADGSAFSPQAVAGVNATLTGGLPGVIAGDGVVEFTFPGTLNFPAADRVFYRGMRPVRIIVQGTITIPAGMVVDGTTGAGSGSGGVAAFANGGGGGDGLLFRFR